MLFWLQLRIYKSLRISSFLFSSSSSKIQIKCFESFAKQLEFKSVMQFIDCLIGVIMVLPFLAGTQFFSLLVGLVIGFVFGFLLAQANFMILGYMILGGLFNQFSQNRTNHYLKIILSNRVCLHRGAHHHRPCSVDQWSMAKIVAREQKWIANKMLIK